MNQKFLPAPDAQCLTELSAAITKWLQQRCMETKTHGRIQWSMNFSLTAFYAVGGIRTVGVRPNDTIGGETVESEPVETKKKGQKRRVLTDKVVKTVERDRDWRRMLNGPEQPEAEVRPDSFRYRERERFRADDASE